MFDYLEQYEGLREEVLDAVTRVLESGRLILGSEVSLFEEEFAQFLHNDGFGVGVASGTDAVVVALLGLGIGPGDEVVTVYADAKVSRNVAGEVRNLNATVE